PFFASKVGKLHEASCVPRREKTSRNVEKQRFYHKSERNHKRQSETFERVIVQNILHGLSPSLSDAIQSIQRWRLIRSAFPHVVQCLASLLKERETESLQQQQQQRQHSQHQLQKDHDESAPGGAAGPARMSQSLVKMMYILHWMLLDSAAECMDAEANGDQTKSGKSNEEMLNQYTMPLNCIALFVYQFAPLIDLVQENDIIDNIRLENGLPLWQSLWDNSRRSVVGAQLSGAQLSGAQLSQRSVVWCSVVGAQLSGAQLSSHGSSKPAPAGAGFEVLYFVFLMTAGAGCQLRFNRNF
uniref:Cation channel complex component UNC80 N-terminal domain-containing protein n=1 Tax=Romanomermis culicivorax TaxID=13658 RepID=A0A915KJ48_ROMCU